MFQLDRSRRKMRNIGHHETLSSIGVHFVVPSRGGVQNKVELSNYARYVEQMSRGEYSQPTSQPSNHFCGHIIIIIIIKNLEL